MLPAYRLRHMLLACLLRRMLPAYRLRHMLPVLLFP
jgi:hypothetical protein